jgi:hypothetical protein
MSTVMIGTVIIIADPQRGFGRFALGYRGPPCKIASAAAMLEGRPALGSGALNDSRSSSTFDMGAIGTQDGQATGSPKRPAAASIRSS